MDITTNIPSIAYFVFTIPAANMGKDHFKNKVTPEEFLNSIEFVEDYAHNTFKRDLQSRYFHMFSGTEDYLGKHKYFYCVFSNK